MNRLPAGLLDHNYEFFTHDGVFAYCLAHGRVIPFEEWDDNLLYIVEQAMAKYPVKIYGIQQMGYTDRLDIIKQFIICNYGGFDHLADMINGEFKAAEYWPCPQRGICEFEGIVCDRLKTDTGNFLTDREIEYVKHTAAGCADKEIASRMNISSLTVLTHGRNVRNKTGLFNKSDITRFAYQKQIAS